MILGTTICDWCIDHIRSLGDIPVVDPSEFSSYLVAESSRVVYRSLVSILWKNTLRITQTNVLLHFAILPMILGTTICDWCIDHIRSLGDIPVVDPSELSSYLVAESSRIVYRLLIYHLWANPPNFKHAGATFWSSAMSLFTWCSASIVTKCSFTTYELTIPSYESFAYVSWTHEAKRLF